MNKNLVIVRNNEIIGKKTSFFVLYNEIRSNPGFLFVTRMDYTNFVFDIKNKM